MYVRYARGLTNGLNGAQHTMLSDHENNFWREERCRGPVWSAIGVSVRGEKGMGLFIIVGVVAQ